MGEARSSVAHSINTSVLLARKRARRRGPGPLKMWEVAAHPRVLAGERKASVCGAPLEPRAALARGPLQLLETPATLSVQGWWPGSQALCQGRGCHPDTHTPGKRCLQSGPFTCVQLGWRPRLSNPWWPLSWEVGHRPAAEAKACAGKDLARAVPCPVPQGRRFGAQSA